MAKQLLTGKTTTGAGRAFTLTGEGSVVANRTFHASGTTSSGSGAATINVEVSNDNSNWLVLGTITLTLGTTSTSDAFASTAAWVYARGNVTAISGTGASVNLIMGV